MIYIFMLKTKEGFFSGEGKKERQKVKSENKIFPGANFYSKFRGMTCFF